MLQVFSTKGASLKVETDSKDLTNALWVDVTNPTPEETALVEAD
jgi:hypothetical protein